MNSLFAGSTFLAGGGWEGFKTTMTDFFQNGLGNSGFQGIGIAVMVVGFMMAVISFAMHHFNPQSRMPSWIICLIIGVAGSFLTFGMSKPIQIFGMVRDWIMSLFGL